MTGTNHHFQLQHVDVFLLLAFTSLFFLPSAVSQAVAGNSKASIKKIFADSEGLIHIAANGSELVIPKEKDQISCDQPKLGEDQKTAGWRINYDNCCTSYPVPLTLVIYRGAKVIRHFSPGQAIGDWQFLKAGREVAFWSGPLYGDFVPHFELHDVSSGKVLAQWDGHIKDNHPDWVSGLKDGD